MIKIAVTGCIGKMGSKILKTSIDRGYEVVAAIESPECEFIGEDVGEILGIGPIDVKIISSSPDELDGVLEETNPDVLIDFTIPEATLSFVDRCSDKDIAMVIGTTGFDEDQLSYMRKKIKEKIPAVISPNFSIGTNVFWDLVYTAANSLDYDVEIVEAHHNKKEDAPSGTAIRTADIVEKARGESNRSYGREGISLRDEDEIGIHAVRAGDIVGDHTVYMSGWDSGERLEITHRAHSRQTFVNGALKAAEFVVNQDIGIYDMKDVLELK